MDVERRDRIMCVWLDERSENTAKYYRRDLLRLDEWLNEKGLSVLTPPTLEDLVFYVNLVPRSHVMKEQAKLVLRSFYGFCFESGYLPVNPARSLRLAPPRLVLGERIPSPEAVRGVYRSARELSSNPFVQCRNQLICELAFLAGARLTEISAIHVDDLQSVKNGVQVRLKGKRGKTRWVLLPDDFAERLLAWIQSHGYPFLFPTIYGKRLGRHGIALIIKRAAIRAGYPDFSTHWFRHAHASESIDNGCPLSVVQVTLGHTNIATTSRYVHARPSTSSALYLSLRETTFVGIPREGVHGAAWRPCTGIHARIPGRHIKEPS